MSGQKQKDYISSQQYNFSVSLRAESCTRKLCPKINCRLKVNCKNKFTKIECACRKLIHNCKNYNLNSKVNCNLCMLSLHNALLPFFLSSNIFHLATIYFLRLQLNFVCHIIKVHDSPYESKLWTLILTALVYNSFLDAAQFTCT